MRLISRGLSSTANDHATTFSETQNRAVLIAGLTCACLSLLATFITLRWFILMKRTFRHRLILFLICSDTFKAVWYFVFPIVVFSRGQVSNNSNFCQASGFFLALGIEASDFSILLIALHSIIYIFKPSTRSGDSGGLYRWRNWLYPVWLGFPLLFASLAFINDQGAYVTAGTYCYLPRRPFWYRLALSWIPRYLILSLIFCMYAAVYIYVTVKFHSFSHLNDSEDQFSSHSQSRSHLSSYIPEPEPDVAPDEVVPSREPEKKPTVARPGWSRQGSYRNEIPTRPTDPWDEVSFITAKPLRHTSPRQSGIHSSDFAVPNQEQNNSRTSRNPSFRMDSFAAQDRKPSACPTNASSYTGDTMTVPSGEQTPKGNGQHGHHGSYFHKHPTPSQPRPNDPLKRTRSAIRRQLRYLFIYPAVYVLMWIFPFASHCLLYDDYYVQHPVYWLTVLQTCMLALQAAADCTVFSWREKPWRRIPEDSKFAMNNIRHSFTGRKNSNKTTSNKISVDIAPDEQLGSLENGHVGVRSGNSSRATSTHWWEAEGRKRKDSVWMGSDTSDVTNMNFERRDTLIEPLATIVSEDDGEAAAEREQQLQQRDQFTSNSNAPPDVGREQDRTNMPTSLDHG